MSSFQWSEFWENVPGALAVIFIFGGGVIAGIVSMIVNAMRHNKEGERNAVLKQQMLDRGMSADEIVRVIQATPPPAK